MSTVGHKATSEQPGSGGYLAAAQSVDEGRDATSLATTAGSAYEYNCAKGYLAGRGTRMLTLVCSSERFPSQWVGAESAEPEPLLCCFAQGTAGRATGTSAKGASCVCRSSGVDRWEGVACDVKSKVRLLIHQPCRSFLVLCCSCC